MPHWAEFGIPINDPAASGRGMSGIISSFAASGGELTHKKIKPKWQSPDYCNKLPLSSISI